MDWFKPTTGAISELATSCMGLVVIAYLLNLRKKTKDARRFILLYSVAIVQEILTFIYDSNISSTSFGLGAETLLNASRYISYVYLLLWVAYRFHKNIYPRESVIIPLIFIILSCFSFALWFTERQINKPPSVFNFIFQLSIYTIETLYATILYVRKMKAFLKQNASSFYKEFIRPSTKEVAAYRGFIISMFILTAIWVLLFLTLSQITSWLVWAYTSYLLLLFLIPFISYTYINYAPEQTSFQANLVCTTLFIVLIVLGIIPLILFGDTRFSVVSDAEEQQIKSFLFIIPITTLLIAFFLPLLFRTTVLNNLNKIMAGVQQVNAGDLSANVKVEVNDEIGSLSRNFNRMTGSLQRYANKMNDLVDERTNELNKSLQELKSTQAQLIQSEKMASLGELTAGIAHEIQNPLNFVNNFSELNKELLEELKEEADKGNLDEVKTIANDVIENEKKINQHGKRADAIVKGMLQHSRKNTGKKEPTDLNALCDEYLRLSYHGLRAKDKLFNADFKTDFDETIGQINIVPQDMGRVLLNLFNNAFYAVNERQKSPQPLKGSEYKPLVTVTTRKINSSSGVGGIEITVKDNGNGIPKSVIDKIFQPFFTTKPTGQGTGLGLSLSYDIITKEHGGTIKAESKEGEGTSFIIVLPV